MRTTYLYTYYYLISGYTTNMDERTKIEQVLLKKSPLSIKGILEKIKITIPASTTKGTYKRLRNPKYIKVVSKYAQTNLYDSYNSKRHTLCSQGKVFRLNKDDFLEHPEQKIKIPAKQFMGYYGGWQKQVHSYYFAIPKTYFVKTKVFDEIIRNIFLKSQEISKYIEHKEEIEQLLKDAEKFMSWIEITPSIDKEENSKNLYKSDNFTQYIIDYICEEKDIGGALFLITDYCLAPVLEKIEDLLLFGNSNDSYINVYRIFRKELSERKIIELPRDYKEHVEGMIFGKVLKESMTNKKFNNFLHKELIIKSKK